MNPAVEDTSKTQENRPSSKPTLASKELGKDPETDAPASQLAKPLGAASVPESCAIRTNFPPESTGKTTKTLVSSNVPVQQLNTTRRATQLTLAKGDVCV